MPNNNNNNNIDFLTWSPNGINSNDHSVAAIFRIYSIFSNRNQISLFSRKAYDEFVRMTGKKVGCPGSLVSYSHFSTDRAQYQGKSTMFSVCACMRARA